MCVFFLCFQFTSMFDDMMVKMLMMKKMKVMMILMVVKTG